MLQDYYTILELPKDAKTIDVLEAYNRLALKHHPQMNDSEASKKEFLALTEAYLVLQDGEWRPVYDDLYARSENRLTALTIGDIEPKIRDTVQDWQSLAKTRVEEYTAMGFEDFGELIYARARYFKHNNALLPTSPPPAPVKLEDQPSSLPGCFHRFTNLAIAMALLFFAVFLIYTGYDELSEKEVYDMPWDAIAIVFFSGLSLFMFIASPILAWRAFKGIRFYKV